MKRRFEVAMTTLVTIEIDDEITSDAYPGETILTAHENRARFVEGSTVETALHSIAVAVGIDGRGLSRVDGWADFPDAAAVALGWAEHTFDSVDELTTPPANPVAGGGHD